jgi:lysophospholipase L1-like esterase
MIMDYRFRRSFLFVSILIICFCTCQIHPQTGRKIAAFGSSVCNGTGDNLKQGGYIGRFKELMAKYGWEVVNVSRGGDNTSTIQERWEKTDKPTKREVKDNQYLLPQKPDYVIIGLSLNNEGLRKVSEEQQDSLFDKFKNGLTGIIDRCKKEGYKVVVANCYPHQLFTESQYQVTKKMNMLINSWKVPSINLLGAIDDGQGHWGELFNSDDTHPSGGGHREMSFAIVPTLFDALAAGKPAPEFSSSGKFVIINGKAHPAFSFTPRDTIHSFAVSFVFKYLEDCTLLAMAGHDANVVTTQFTAKEVQKQGIELYASPDSTERSVEIKDSELLYHSEEGNMISGGKLIKGVMYKLTISHCLARGTMDVYVGDQRIGSMPERFIPAEFRFVINGKTALKDLLIYRSSLNAEEVHAINRNQMIQYSLEVYAPLIDYASGKPINNLAQSEAELKMNK